jgi:alkanesulfonate monooxygenase SsuD/methylene tetrahydromethanopterin reductase-like flavin-dependent oxidoreductase (luciferase family)
VLLPHRVPARELVSFATAAEDAGVDDLWIPENFGFVGAYSAAAVALASTRRIRVGTGISAVPLRHPVANAMEVGTLAGAFPGRYVAGLGMGVRGWLTELNRWPSSPVREIREAVRAISGLLRGEKVSASTELFEMGGVRIDEGVQAPCLVHVGAVGPAMLRVGAQDADGVILSVLSSPEYVRWARQQVDTADGRTEVVCFVNLSIDDGGTEPAAALLREDTAFLLAAMGRSPLIEPLGIGDELTKLLADHGHDRGELARVLPARWIEQMSIVGTVTQCAERVRDYIEAGADTVVLAPKPAAAAHAIVARIPELLVQELSDR